MKEGRKPEYSEKSPDDEFQRMPHTKSLKIQAPTETSTCTLAFVAGACYEPKSANHNTTRRSLLPMILKLALPCYWYLATIIWTGQDYPTGNSSRRKTKRQTEETMGRQHQRVDWPRLSYREQFKEADEEADRGNDGKTTSKSGLALNGICYYGKLRTARSGGSWL